VVFSDLAAHAFAGERNSAEGAGVVVEWRPAVDGAPPANRAITAARVETVSTRAGAALAVHFDAARFSSSSGGSGGAEGAADGGDVEVDLFLGDARAARMRVAAEDARAVSKVFHVPLPDARDPEAPGGGTGAGGASSATGAGGAPHADELTVSIAKDALNLDDSITLPLDAGGALEVLIVDGAPQALPFLDEVFYLQNALEQIRGGRARIKLTMVGPEQVTAAAIAGARVVVLANVARLEDAAALALVDHVKAGAGLLVTMGDQVDVDWYRAALTDVLPAPLRGSKGQALLDDASVAEVLSLVQLRTDHPILEGLGAPPGASNGAAHVSAQAGDVPGLARVRTHTLMLVEPRPENDAFTLARFSNGAPALVEHEVGAGRSLVLLTSVDRDWSDLAIRPGYVPLVQQMVLYLGGALEDSGPRLVRVSEPKRIRVPRGAVEVLVEKPGGVVRTLKPAEAERDVTFTDTDVVGLYRVSSRGDGGDARPLSAERFSVAIDPAESDLRRAPADVLAASVPKGALSRGASEDDRNVRLWPLLLIAAAVLLLLEALVLRRSAG
jgi:hypothetical protein